MMKRVVLIEKRWSSLKELSDSCGQSLAEMVNDLKGFDVANAQITSWLGQKEKMIEFLGPIAAEPVMIRNQIQQLEVILMCCYQVTCQVTYCVWLEMIQSVRITLTESCS